MTILGSLSSRIEGFIRLEKSIIKECYMKKYFLLLFTLGCYITSINGTSLVIHNNTPYTLVGVEVKYYDWLCANDKNITIPAGKSFTVSWGASSCTLESMYFRTKEDHNYSYRQEFKKEDAVFIPASGKLNYYVNWDKEKNKMLSSGDILDHNKNTVASIPKYVNHEQVSGMEVYNPRYRYNDY